MAQLTLQTYLTELILIKMYLLLVRYSYQFILRGNITEESVLYKSDVASPWS
jgi:hypothetical protein